jgi:hypothetical protein
MLLLECHHGHVLTLEPPSGETFEGGNGLELRERRRTADIDDLTQFTLASRRRDGEGRDITLRRLRQRPAAEVPDGGR